MQKKINELKVFIGPQEVAGYYRNLTVGFKELGISCDYMTLNDHPFNYGGQSSKPLFLKLIYWLNNIKVNYYLPSLFYHTLTIASEFFRLIWALSLIFKYDVFIFGFGNSLMRKNLDLPLLKLFGKVVISNLGHGSEARPAYIDGSFQSFSGNDISIRRKFEISRKTHLKVNRHFKYSRYVIGSPMSTSQFAKSSFINFFALGIPFTNLDQSIASNLREEADTQNDLDDYVRILHCPSHPAAKGTPIITSAINNLVKRGYKIQFVLIHGKSSSEVMKEIQLCDFVVDQVYSDTPMASFATEAAWFAKPAIVGGYGFDTLRSILPSYSWPPSKTCHPDQVEHSIEELINNVALRKKLGQDAKAFVQQRWHCINVAQRYLSLINSKVPESWWINPYDVVYIEGACQPICKTMYTIREIISRYGIDGLQLSHRPDLKSIILGKMTNQKDIQFG
jgi:glycosyltransferase involved in cell wall biosynthesis